jgi:hypothetical protein
MCEALGRGDLLANSTDSHEPLPAMANNFGPLPFIVTMLDVSLLAIQLFNDPNPPDVGIFRGKLWSSGRNSAGRSLDSDLRAYKTVWLVNQ